MLISLEQTPSRLVPSPKPEHLTLVDGVSCPPFASTSSLAPHLVDWQATGGLSRLLDKVTEGVERALKTSDRLTIVLDSVTRLAEEGSNEAVKVIRAILARIKPFPGRLS